MPKKEIIREYEAARRILKNIDYVSSHYTKSGAMNAGKLIGEAKGFMLGVDIALAMMNLEFKYNENCEIIDIVESTRKEN